MTKGQKTKLAILSALVGMEGPVGGSRLTESLSAMGVSLQSRTIRLYLQQMDAEGLTRFVSRRQGREITERGREELAHSNVVEKVGFIAAKVDTLVYKMTYSNRDGKGTIVTNVTLMDRRVLGLALREMAKVMAAGWGMGTRMVVMEGGQRLAGMLTPDGMVAIGTVCSVTVNGILLNAGIPVMSRFGGLVEVRDGVPIRFVELIDYRGTTLDPLEAFIRADMTRVRAGIERRSGIIGASFREVPSVAVKELVRLQKEMAARGLDGLLLVGKPNRPLLDIPVGEGRTGIVVMGGLNPVAAVHEAGVRLSMFSLAGLEEYSAFEDYQKVCAKFE